jgi:hypothetical protein
VAMLKLLNKNPDAFSGGGRKANTKGCRCQKSRYVIEFYQCIAALFCAFVIHLKYYFASLFISYAGASKSFANVSHRESVVQKVVDVWTVRTRPKK